MGIFKRTQKKEPMIPEFTMVVEESSADGRTAVGMLHGRAEPGMEAYLACPDGSFVTGRIDRVRTLSDGMSAIGLVGFPEKFARFLVLTSVMPHVEIDMSVSAENPQLVGLIREYERMKSAGPEYYNRLFSAISHARYIAPFTADREIVDAGDGTALFKKDTVLAFTHLVDIDSGESFFRLFTDLRALAASSGSLPDDQKIMNIRFPQVVKYYLKGLDGVIINPGSETETRLSTNLIRNIASSPAWQQEFGGKE